MPSLKPPIKNQEQQKRHQVFALISLQKKERQDNKVGKGHDINLFAERGAVKEQAREQGIDRRRQQRFLPVAVDQKDREIKSQQRQRGKNYAWQPRGDFGHAENLIKKGVRQYEPLRM